MDLGKGRTTKCLERVRYERNIDDPLLKSDPDPGPCDWEDMSDNEVDATPYKGRCRFHQKQRNAELVRVLEAATGGRNLN
jgi:hypothetical protein